MWITDEAPKRGEDCLYVWVMVPGKDKPVLDRTNWVAGQWEVGNEIPWMPVQTPPPPPQRRRYSIPIDKSGAIRLDGYKDETTTIELVEVFRGDPDPDGVSRAAEMVGGFASNKKDMPWGLCQVAYALLRGKI